jgi:light-regulated signal transduction histidine kinase (bacteriophytochrome)
VSQISNFFKNLSDSCRWLLRWQETEARSVIAPDVTEAKGVGDVTQQRILQLEGTVAKQTEQLAASRSEMEAFAYAVSHDLRAPLRGVMGFANILEEDYGSQLDQEARRIAGIIRSNAFKMGALIDDLLTFSRTGKQDIKKTTVDTAAVVRQIVSNLAVGAAAGKAHFDLMDLPHMNADPNMIRQVWSHLISNAIKFSGKEDVPKIEIGSHLTDGMTVYYIRDNGAGFDDQHKGRLFKIFQRLHAADEFEGTGVGLALVHQIISKHGGRVWAEGKVGVGACFSFTVTGLGYQQLRNIQTF